MSGTPRWVLLLHGLAGAAAALTWLYTLPLQLRLIVAIAQTMQP